MLKSLFTIFHRFYDDVIGFLISDICCLQIFLESLINLFITITSYHMIYFISKNGIFNNNLFFLKSSWKYHSLKPY